MPFELRAVAVGDASSEFDRLVERVEAGEEITITRNGAPVARMVPVARTGTPESRAAAIAKMDEIASRNRLDGLKVSDLIAEGRR